MQRDLKYYVEKLSKYDLETTHILHTNEVTQAAASFFYESQDEQIAFLLQQNDLAIFVNLYHYSPENFKKIIDKNSNIFDNLKSFKLPNLNKKESSDLSVKLCIYILQFMLNFYDKLESRIINDDILFSEISDKLNSVYDKDNKLLFQTITNEKLFKTFFIDCNRNLNERIRFDGAIFNNTPWVIHGVSFHNFQTLIETHASCMSEAVQWKHGNLFKKNPFKNHRYGNPQEIFLETVINALKKHCNPPQIGFFHFVFLDAHPDLINEMCENEALYDKTTFLTSLKKGEENFIIATHGYMRNEPDGTRFKINAFFQKKLLLRSLVAWGEDYNIKCFSDYLKKCAHSDFLKAYAQYYGLKKEEYDTLLAAAIKENNTEFKANSMEKSEKEDSQFELDILTAITLGIAKYIESNPATPAPSEKLNKLIEKLLQNNLLDTVIVLLRAINTNLLDPQTKGISNQNLNALYSLYKNYIILMNQHNYSREDIKKINLCFPDENLQLLQMGELLIEKKDYLSAFKCFNNVYQTDKMYAKEAAGIAIAHMLYNKEIKFISSHSGKYEISLYDEQFPQSENNKEEISPSNEITLPAIFKATEIEPAIQAYEFIMESVSQEGMQLKNIIMKTLLNEPILNSPDPDSTKFYANLFALHETGVNNLTVFLNYYKEKNPDLYKKIKDNLDLSALIATREKDMLAMKNTVTALTQEVSNLKKENLALNERMKQMETFLKQQFDYSNEKETKGGSVNKNALFRMTY